jgi:ABC-2 type transport system permease protein
VGNFLDTIHLYFKMIGINIRSQMQYRASFIMMMLGNLLVTFIEFITILVLFSRFGSLRGWHLSEVALFYGLINVSFALSEALGRGFDMFSLQIINGEFDRTLLRPRSTSFLVLTHDFLARPGRLLQGLAILLWAIINLGITWNPAKTGLLFFSITGGVMLFTGLLVLQATMCFWSTQSLEVMNSFTDGGIEALQWPLPIFNRWFGRLFIFVIPLACVNYFPMLVILNKPDVLGYPVWFQWVSPLAGVLFLVISLLVWRIGVRHYHSTGS